MGANKLEGQEIILLYKNVTVILEYLPEHFTCVIY